MFLRKQKKVQKVLRRCVSKHHLILNSENYILNLMEEKKEENLAFKKEELHKAALNAYINISNEFDKLIFGISIAGIGFLLNYFIKDFKLASQPDLIILFSGIFSIISFSITTLIILFGIFPGNKSFLLKILKGKYEEPPILKKLDSLVAFSFFIGILNTIIFAIIIIIKNSYFGGPIQ
jgi:glucan phosphoethanolaminetransferase (alkaline phosphatase superfamily)